MVPQSTTQPNKKQKRANEKPKKKKCSTSRKLPSWRSYHGLENTSVKDPKGKGKAREVPNWADQLRATVEEVEKERKDEIMNEILSELEKMDKELVECYTNPATSGKVGESSAMVALLGKGWCGSDDGNEVGEGFAL